MIDRDPPLCVVHAGLNAGKGAKAGNRNAVKHGLYMSVLGPDEMVDLEMVTSTSLMHELVLTRAAMRRLAKHLAGESPALEALLAIAPVLFTGVRTIAFLLNHIDEDSFDWDEVLDELGKDWGRRL